MKPIKVLPLGVSGAGKSVYLASLYDKLAMGSAEACFRLQAPAPLSMRLSAIFAAIKDPSRPWPPGTRGGEFIDVNFDCMVDARDASFCITKLLYLEFPGGLLTGEIENPEYIKRLEETDAFLVLLDGAKVFRALMKDDDARSDLENDLGVLLNPIQDRLRKPLHFVLTKWDVVQTRFTLAEVSQLLFGFPKFRRLVDNQAALGRGTRLIPVSAVGAGFCELDGAGEMKKRPGAHAAPYNVDVPISCLMFDLIDSLNKNLGEQHSKTFWRRLWYRIVGSSALLASVSNAAIEWLPLPSGWGVIKTFLSLGTEGLMEFASSERTALEMKYGRAILDAKNAQQAFGDLAKYHALEVHWLQRQFPESVLRAG
jgi:hypothetical protein